MVESRLVAVESAVGHLEATLEGLQDACTGGPGSMTAATTSCCGARRRAVERTTIKPFVTPFIIPPAQQRPKEEIKIQEVSRLETPPKVSFFPALFSSSVGLVVLFVIYAANLYAAMEIAIFRARPIGLVMGVAAVLPILGPIIFLSLPIRREGRSPSRTRKPRLKRWPYGCRAGRRPLVQPPGRNSRWLGRGQPGAGASGSPDFPARPVHVQPPVF